MNPGKLKDRITILKPIENSSAVKSLSNNAYEPHKTIWSKVEYVSSKEIFSANANNTLNVVKFIVRYRKDIKSNMRIQHDENIYEIKGIRPLDTKKMYLLITGEVVEHE